MTLLFSNAELSHEPESVFFDRFRLVLALIEDSGRVRNRFAATSLSKQMESSVAVSELGSLTARDGPPMVEAQAVWKVYETGALKVEALRGLDLKVRKGEMVAVMGPSGCGKTTLLNCLSGLDDITKGKVAIEGVDLATMSDDQKSAFRAKRMGFIFQAYNLLPVLNAQENVELPLLLAGISEADARKEASSALKMVGLEEWRLHKPMELSGGQQQRVTIARALVNKPAIVWGDEPTGNLDSENSGEIVKLLRSLNRDYGLTFVIVTHDPGIAMETDRIVSMRNGQIEKETSTISKT